MTTDKYSEQLDHSTMAGSSLSFRDVREACQSLDDASFLLWSAKMELIPDVQDESVAPMCCGTHMRLCERAASPDRYEYRCTTCKAQRSIRLNSWTRGSHLSLRKLAMLLACWIDGRAVHIAAEDCGVNRLTVLSYYAEFRRVAGERYHKDIAMNPLGGPGIILQVDESYFGKPKYNIGKAWALPPLWVFGIVDTHSRRVMLEAVEDRSSGTLVPMIDSTSAPGSRVWSDQWKGYSGLDDAGLDHDTVNHSVNFVSEDGVHTQMIESTWAAVKGFLRGRHIKARSTVMEHVHEWCFRRNLGSSFVACWHLLNNDS